MRHLYNSKFNASCVCSVKKEVILDGAVGNFVTVFCKIEFSITSLIK